MSRVASISFAVLAFLWGAGQAFSGFNYWQGIAYPERFAWWCWVPSMAAGCVAAVAVLALPLWPRPSALAIALSMLVIAMSEIVDFFRFFGGRRSLISTAFSVIVGCFIYWRFARVPRVVKRKV